MCRNLPDSGWYRPDATSIGPIPTRIWQIVTYLQGYQYGKKSLWMTYERFENLLFMDMETPLRQKYLLHCNANAPEFKINSGAPIVYMIYMIHLYKTVYKIALGFYPLNQRHNILWKIQDLPPQCAACIRSEELDIPRCLLKRKF